MKWIFVALLLFSATVLADVTEPWNTSHNTPHWTRNALEEVTLIVEISNVASLPINVDVSLDNIHDKLDKLLPLHHRLLLLTLQVEQLGQDLQVSFTDSANRPLCETLSRPVKIKIDPAMPFARYYARIEQYTDGSPTQCFLYPDYAHDMVG